MLGWREFNFVRVVRVMVIVSVKHVVFSLYVFSLSYTYLRGARRFKIVRHLTDVWMIISPINVLMYLFSKKSLNKPYISLDEFKELDVFQENWQAIRDEALTLYKNSNIKQKLEKDDVGFYDLGFYSFLKSGWNRFYLKWYDTDFGSAEKLCPKTLAMVRAVPSVKAAMFALLPPGAKLNLHRDPYAGSLRYHLGLSTPNSDLCNIIVDGQTYSWRDGKAVMFDETYLHEAVNKSDQDRLIFFCDVERPIRFSLVRLINKYFSKFIMSNACAPNLTGDKSGIINKIFSYVYVLRLQAKKLKAWNELVYKISEYSLLIAAAYFIFIW